MVTVEYSVDGSSYTDITDKTLSMKWSKNAEIEQNRFDLNLNPNILGDTIAVIKSGEFIKILNGATQVFLGLILSVDYSVGQKETLLVSGTDASMDLFGGQVPYIYESQTASAIIIDLVTTEFSGTRSGITAVAVGSGGHIQATTVSIDHFYGTGRRLYDVLLDLCLPENTDGSTYYTFYVDDDNELHFEPRGSTGYSIVKADMVSYSISLSMATKFNNVVIYCGTDTDGDDIYVTYPDPDGYAAMGGRLVSRYFDEHVIAEKIIEEHPGYNDAEVVAACEDTAEPMAKKYLHYYGSVKKVIKMVLPGTFNYSIGSEIDITAPQATDIKWSLTGISQKIGQNGWETILTGEEVI